MPIKVRYNGLEVDGNLVQLVSASLHYWSLDPEMWSSLLDQVKELGFQAVETAVPWSVHEVASGDFDFGKTDPAKNLDQFLTLAEEKGLKIIVRPGPHVNTELPGFGIPRRILEDAQFWSRDSFGGPCVIMAATSQFNAPSYAHEGLISEFEPFLAAVAPVLQKHLHPNGGVLALQVDNQAGYFARPGNYDQDYSDASLKLYRHFLEMKYRQLKGINDAYGVKHKSFDDVEAPRKPDLSSLEGLRRGLDWADYKEYQLLWFLSKLSELFKAKGLGGVPFFHNFPSSVETPFNIADVEKDSGIEFCGLVSSQGAAGTGISLDQARYLSASSLLPYFPDYGAGSAAFGGVARDLADHAANILAPLMGGARAINFSMIVEREGWLGSPLSAQGRERPDMAAVFRNFNRFLREQDWGKSSTQNAAVLLASRELQQISAASLLPGQLADREFFPDALWSSKVPKELLMAEAEMADAKAFYEASKAWLRENSFSYALSDSAVAIDKLKKHSFAMATTWGCMDEAYARRLRSFVEGGGFLVLGPEIPKVNKRFEKLAAFDGFKIEEGKPLAIGDGKLLLLRSFDSKQAANFIRKGKVIPEVTLSDSSLDLALHKVAGRMVLFVRNPQGEERPCTVIRDGKFVLKPLWSSGKFLGAVEEREVKLAPYEIKVWEVIPC